LREKNSGDENKEEVLISQEVFEDDLELEEKIIPLENLPI
jgi:hypothetical protein